MKSVKGFSMLELVIIIMIMTVLAGVMSPMFFQSKEQANKAKANKAKADSEISAIATAIKSYYAKTGKVPPSIIPLTTTQEVITELKKSGYISQNWTDLKDPWGRGPGPKSVPFSGYYIEYDGVPADGIITEPTSPFTMQKNIRISIGYPASPNGSINEITVVDTN